MFALLFGGGIPLGFWTGIVVYGALILCLLACVAAVTCWVGFVTFILIPGLIVTGFVSVFLLPITGVISCLLTIGRSLPEHATERGRRSTLPLFSGPIDFVSTAYRASRANRARQISRSEAWPPISAGSQSLPNHYGSESSYTRVGDQNPGQEEQADEREQDLETMSASSTQVEIDLDEGSVSLEVQEAVGSGHAGGANSNSNTVLGQRPAVATQRKTGKGKAKGKRKTVDFVPLAVSNAYTSSSPKGVPPLAPPDANVSSSRAPQAKAESLGGDSVSSSQLEAIIEALDPGLSTEVSPPSSSSSRSCCGESIFSAKFTSPDSGSPPDLV